MLKTSAAELLSESSLAPSDQALQIAALLAGLSAKDSEFVLDQIKKLALHLRQRAH